MRRQHSLRAEVLAGEHDALAEQLLPMAIGDDARSERVLRSTSHLARPKPISRQVVGKRRKDSGVSGLTSSPGLRKLPRMNMCVFRCSSAASSFMIGVLSGLYSSLKPPLDVLALVRRAFSTPAAASGSTW